MIYGYRPNISLFIGLVVYFFLETFKDMGFHILFFLFFLQTMTSLFWGVTHSWFCFVLQFVSVKKLIWFKISRASQMKEKLIISCYYFLFSRQCFAVSNFLLFKSPWPICTWVFNFHVINFLHLKLFYAWKKSFNPTRSTHFMVW